MTEHTVTAVEPRQHEIHLESVGAKVEEIREIIERPSNWRAMSANECSCGEEFRRREQAEQHLSQPDD